MKLVKFSSPKPGTNWKLGWALASSRFSISPRAATQPTSPSSRPRENSPILPGFSPSLARNTSLPLALSVR